MCNGAGGGPLERPIGWDTDLNSKMTGSLSRILLQVLHGLMQAIWPVKAQVHWTAVSGPAAEMAGELVIFV